MDYYHYYHYSIKLFFNRNVFLKIIKYKNERIFRILLITCFIALY